MATDSWTIERQIERMKQLAESHHLTVLFSQPIVKELGDNSALLLGPGEKKEGTILMGDPHQDYTSPQHFLLVFLNELEHVIYDKVCEDVEAGEYGRMLKEECAFRKELWCWSGTLDMARMVFGLELTEELTNWILNKLNKYGKKEYLKYEKEQVK